jgi:hypothetical protein
MPPRLHIPPSKSGVSESFIANLLIVKSAARDSYGATLKSKK